MKLCSLISERKTIILRAWLTLVRAVPVHCLGPLTNTFRARAVSIHNVKSSKGTMKAAFISTSSYSKENGSSERNCFISQ
jgi:hypothetical protein